MRRILISIQNAIFIYTQGTRKSVQTKLPYNFYFVISKLYFYTMHLYLYILLEADKLLLYLQDWKTARTEKEKTTLFVDMK